MASHAIMGTLGRQADPTVLRNHHHKRGERQPGDTGSSALVHKDGRCLGAAPLEGARRLAVSPSLRSAPALLKFTPRRSVFWGLMLTLKNDRHGSSPLNENFKKEKMTCAGFDI